MDKGKLDKAVAEAAVEGTDPAGENYRLLSLAVTGELARKYAVQPRLIEISALENEIIPERYQRSIGILGAAGQKKLLASCVGVVGAGGLGGFALELLARMGVGKLIVVDSDSFTESNLNRQLYATEKNLQEPKAEAAVKRIGEVNGAAEVEAYNLRGDASNLPGIFRDSNLVLDCLDNLPSRFALEKVCSELGVIMVHGAIAGFLGQLAVIRPGKPLLSAIYGPDAGGAEKGIEVRVGNPAFTPAMLASYQVGEAVKILAGLDDVLPENRLLIIEMQTGESFQIELSAVK